MQRNAYLASMVRRWHTNPHLAHTSDPVGYHSGRMAILALDFFGINGPLLAGCLTHDLGEYLTGDAPYGSPCKDHPAERKARQEIRMDFPCDARVKFLDLLDSYLWASHHAPNLVLQKDWQDQLLTIQEMAANLGVESKLEGYLNGDCNG